MPGEAIDKRYATKTERPLDPCFVETERLGRALPGARPGEDPPKVHVIRASRWIVLSQDDPDATVENSVKVAKGEHLLVYGDRVRVAGRIELRGLDVTINCRELEFVATSKGTPPEIDVTGVDGEDPALGLNAMAPSQAAQGTKEDPKGKNGTPGAAGEDVHKGKSGGKGGTISISCDTMKPLAPVTLKANGGKGGAAVRGQDGQQGGNGLEGATTDYDYSGKTARSAVGGAGGIGGNGGDAGDGGEGGQIELYCPNMRPASHPVTLSVVGGDGGKGGAAGNGGKGGNGGKPANGSLQKDGSGFNAGYRLQDGADSGAGGPPGVAGWGGGCGKPGTIKLRCAAEAVRYLAQKFAQEKTASLRLIWKSGVLGDRGDSASWGAAGEPGKPASDVVQRLPGRDGGVVSGTKQKPGNPGNRPNPDLKRTVTRTAPVKQGPVQRIWEVWEGVPAPPTPTMASPGPEPTEPPIPEHLLASMEIYRKDLKIWGGHLKAAERQIKIYKDAFIEEKRQWELADREYKEYQRKYQEERRKYDEEISLKEIWKQAELNDIAAGQNTEQLQMLYDYARTRYLLAPSGRATAVPYLPEQVAWLVNVAHAKLKPRMVKRGDKEEEVLDEPADVFHLWQAASSTNRNLWLGNNLFGHDARYAVLGDPKKHAKALQDMRTNLKDIETNYQQNVRFDNMAQDWAANWSQVKQAAQGVKNDMEEKQTAIKEKLAEVLPAIEQKESLRDELFEELKRASTEFEVEFKGKMKGLTPQDFFGMLNQLSFTNREFHNHAGEFLAGGAMAGGAMLVSQAGELMAKAMDNVVTDTGESVNKKYIIRSVKTLTAKLPTIENLKQERSGLISQNPNAEVRLLATREQLNSILENFYEQSANARKISQTLDAYVDAVQARNAKVDEWNQLLAFYAYCGAESKKADAQSAEVEKTKSNDPGLVAMARFSTALTRHALEDYIKRLYEAGRVCSLRTLRNFDPLASLSEIASESNADIGFVNSAILAKAVNDYIGAVLSSTTTISDLSDMPPIELTLTPKTHPLVFALLRKGKAAPFQILAPDPRAVQPGAKGPADPEEPTAQSNVFALKADVRLTHIKPHVFVEKDNELSSLCSRYTIQLSHSGKETFYRDDGLKVLLNHDPMEKSFEYSEGSGNPDKGKLSSEHSGMIGPFCSWEISIPENGIVCKPETKEQDKNLNRIQSIKIVFEGKCRGFTPAAIETAKKEARAIVTEVTDKTFQELVLKSEKPVVVDFWSKESGSSPALEAMRKAVKGSYAGQIRFAKCNVDDNKETYERYKATDTTIAESTEHKITKVPSLALFTGGHLLLVAEGSLSDNEIRSTLRKVMGQASAELGAGAGAGA